MWHHLLRPKLGINPIFLTIWLVSTVSKVYILLTSRVLKTWFPCSDDVWCGIFSTWRPPGNQVSKTRFISRPFKHQFLFDVAICMCDVVDPRGGPLVNRVSKTISYRAFSKITPFHFHSPSHSLTDQTLMPLSITLSLSRRTSPLSRLSHSPSHSHAVSTLKHPVHSHSPCPLSLCFHSQSPLFHIHPSHSLTNQTLTPFSITLSLSRRTSPLSHLSHSPSHSHTISTLKHPLHSHSPSSLTHPLHSHFVSTLSLHYFTFITFAKRFDKATARRTEIVSNLYHRALSSFSLRSLSKL